MSIQISFPRALKQPLAMLCLYFFVAVLPSACGEKKMDKTVDLIAPDRFAEVLADVRLLEGSYSLKVSKPDTMKLKVASYYEQIFAKHSITRDQFFDSYQYYLHDGKEITAIEDSVMNKLVKMEASQNEFIRQQLPADSSLTDSLSQ